MNTTDSQRGFVATVAVVLLAIGSLAFVAVLTSSVFFYSDSVYRREMRTQKSLNERACADTKILLMQKDFFLKGEVILPEFACSVHVP